MRYSNLSACSAAFPWTEAGSSPVLGTASVQFSLQWAIAMGSLDVCPLFLSRFVNPCKFCLLETLEPDHDVHMDICWQRLEGDNMCSEPLQGRRTTYTECCCLYGIAWSGQCAFCPRRDSGEKQDAHKTVLTLFNNCLYSNASLLLISKM